MIEGLEEYTLEEILAFNSKELREEYFKYLENLATNRIARNVITQLPGESIERIYQEIYFQEEANRSTSFFNGDLVLLHGGIKDQKARSYITCDFSGGIITKGSFYLTYRPLIENIYTNKSYVLKKTIKVETGYYDMLPRNIQELETLERNMQLELDLNDGIDYSHFNRQMGGVLALTPLKKESKKKIRKKCLNENRYC